MSDATYGMAGFGLQKDSEFTQVFNYHLLKAMEHGLVRRSYIDHHKSRFVQEHFGVGEGESLGMNHVMFTFELLAFGAAVSLALAAAEFAVDRWARKGWQMAQ